MTRDEWIAEFAAQAGARPPTPDEIDDLLELAATAAHATHRTAAPLTCWLAGRSDRDLAELKRIAEGVGPAGPASAAGEPA
jgi:Domain of unknown function (DUF6457)